MSQSLPPPGKVGAGGQAAETVSGAGGTPILIHTLKAFERCDAITKLLLFWPKKRLKVFRPLLKNTGCAKLQR